MKIMNLALLLLIAGIVYGQIPIPWENQYNFQEYDVATDICPAYGGGSIIVGCDFEDNWYGELRARITKLSSAGSIAWTSWIDFGDHHPDFGGVCRNEPDRTYACVGTHDINIGTDRELIFAEYDRLGNLLQTKIHDNYALGTDIIALDDGGYLAYVYKDDIYNPRPCLMRTDDQFNIIWETDLLNVCVEDCFALDILLPGNSMCLSPDGNQVVTGVIGAFYPVGIPSYPANATIAIIEISVATGTVLDSYESFWENDDPMQFIGVERYIPIPTPIAPRYVALGNSIPATAYNANFHQSNEFIRFIKFDDQMNTLSSPVTFYPPSPYIGIRAYEFERLSAGGYMVTGNLQDSSYDWHMWMAKFDNDFQLVSSYVGNDSTGSYGLGNLNMDQMGGCVTEAGHFISAGAAFLSTGHTHYNVMFEPQLGGSISTDPQTSALSAEPECTNEILVRSSDGHHNFEIVYAGGIPAQPIAHVYDINGRQVRTLYGEESTAGAVSFNFDGTRSDGLPLSSGVYIVSICNGEETSSATFSLIN